MPVQPINLLPENSVQIYRGQSKTFQLSVKKQDGSVFDLTDKKLVCTVKEKVEDIPPLIQKTSDSVTQIDITTPREGLANIYFVPGDTQTLAVKSYVYDIWVVFQNGKRYPVVKPTTFEVLAGVTLLPL